MKKSIQEPGRENELAVRLYPNDPDYPFTLLIGGECFTLTAREADWLSETLGDDLVQLEKALAKEEE